MTAVERVLELEKQLFEELKDLTGKEFNAIKKAFDLIREVKKMKLTIYLNVEDYEELRKHADGVPLSRYVRRSLKKLWKLEEDKKHE